MISNLDLQKLQDLPIEQVAEALGMPVSHHKTFCHQHDDHVASLTFHRARNRYHCFVCNASGNNIDLVREMLNLPFRDACHWLAQTFGLTLDDGNSSRQFNVTPRKIQPSKKLPTVEQPIDVRHLSKLVANPVLCQEACRFLFEERHISPDVVRQLGISSISQPQPMSGHPLGGWFNAPSLLIPYRDIEGKLLSVQARYLGTSPKGGGREGTPRFQFPKGSICHIFNLPILKSMDQGEDLWITEGVSDCLAMLTAGRKAIAIPSATLLKEEDLALYDFSRLNILCSPDDDEPGIKLFLQLKHYFPNIQHQMLPVGYKDFGAYWADKNSIK